MDLTDIKNDIGSFISQNPIGTALGIGAGVVGAGLVGAALIGSSRKKKTSKGRARDRKFVSREKHERRYKRKTPGKRYKSKKRKSSTGRKGVKYTKNGQPYIIMASGKARFIKGKRRAK